MQSIIYIKQNKAILIDINFYLHFNVFNSIKTTHLKFEKKKKQQNII